MKRRNRQKNTREINFAEAGYTCRFCALSYDWRSFAHGGRAFYGCCPYKDGGARPIELDEAACEFFMLREKNGEENDR